MLCSPFGQHNTKDLTQPVQSRDGERRCPRCEQTLSLSKFYNRRSHIGTSPYCRKCTSDQTVERTRLIKERSITYKGGRCLFCGYDRCVAALEFHHLDSAQKDFSISTCKFADFKRIMVELDKCILVCLNCHREIHAGLIIVSDFSIANEQPSTI